MTEFLHTLLPVKVTRAQWLKVVDIIAPPAKPDASKVAQTKTNNRREQLDAVYQRDSMVAPWNGTAFGVVQAVNMFQHHYANVRGMLRVERVYDRAIRGDFAGSGAQTLDALAHVLDMPESVFGLSGWGGWAADREKRCLPAVLKQHTREGTKG
jgi:hypothetical protein